MFGIFTAIVGMVSTAVTAIGGAIGSAIGIIATTVKNLGILDVICRVISTVAKFLGIINENETPEELGAKATQPDVKSSEEFESTEAYIEYLRNEVELDKERFNKLSAEEKKMCEVAGVGILAKGVEEKTGVEITPEALNTIGEKNISPEEFISLIETFKANGILSLDEMSGYINGTKCENSKTDINSAIAQAFEKLNPQMSPEDVQQKIADMQLKG